LATAHRQFQRTIDARLSETLPAIRRHRRRRVAGKPNTRPDAVPVPDGEQPQWYLQLAFVLRSIKLEGLGGMALVMIARVATRLEKTPG
jgi:hypothetical protein